MNKLFRIFGFGALCAIPGLIVSETPAFAADGYYKGKTLKVVVRSAPGGGYDFYGRLISRHMPRYIPGNPGVIVQNMPGAGGIVAANYMAQRAKRNGTEIAILTRELALAQRVGEIGVKYDLRKLNAIGSATSSTFLMVLHRNHAVKTYAQLKNHNKIVRFAATGPGAGSYQYPSILKSDGFPVKIISGIIGGQARFLSIERGDTHGTANSYESTRKALEEFKLNVFVYNGAPHPALKGVPHISTQLSKNGKAIAALMAAPLAAGRPFYTTPGVPKNRLKILRSAFKAALSDPKLLKEAKRAKRNIRYTNPKVMASIANQVLGASDDVIKRFKEGNKKTYVTHTGKVTKTKKKNKRIYILYKGKEVMAKISGKRTKVMVSGKKVKRKKIKVGMTCSIKYPHPGAEAKFVVCIK